MSTCVRLWVYISFCMCETALAAKIGVKSTWWVSHHIKRYCWSYIVVDQPLCVCVCVCVCESMCVSNWNRPWGAYWKADELAWFYYSGILKSTLWLQRLFADWVYLSLVIDQCRSLIGATDRWHPNVTHTSCLIEYRVCVHVCYIFAHGDVCKNLRRTLTPRAPDVTPWKEVKSSPKSTSLCALRHVRVCVCVCVCVCV